MVASLKSRLARTKRAPLFSALIALLACETPALAQTVRVQTSGGAVVGREVDGRLVFRGVPFAAAPVGALRWQPPQPARWSGARDTTEPAPSCIQGDYGWNRRFHVFASEDCLTLDIGTPSLKGSRPVLVWIHGGSNHAGSPDEVALSGLVAKGVVVVGIRYRLGTLGFLAPRTSGATGGNYGLMDQIAALRWVQANIARFGGDPRAVTIGGESAGSQDVGLLLAAPAARPLFQRAIMQSGTPAFGLPYRTLAEARLIGDQLRSLLGKVDPRQASTAALLAADAKLHDDALNHDDYLWLRATIDGDVLPRAPDILLAEAPAKPLLIGSNVFELDLWGGRPHRDGFLNRSYGANAAAARAYYGIADGRDPAPDPRAGSVDQRIASDGTFICPAERMAAMWAKKGAPVYRYIFDHSPGGGMTNHSRELSYVFKEDRAGGVHLQDYWAAFIKTGRPPADWPAYPQRIRFDARGATAEAGSVPPVCALADAL